jgi:superfamily II DNA or RNA helicase
LSGAQVAWQDTLRETWQELLEAPEARQGLEVWPTPAPPLPPLADLSARAEAALEGVGVRALAGREVQEALHLMERVRLRVSPQSGWVRVSAAGRAVELEPAWGAVRRVALQPYEDRPLGWALLLALAWRTPEGRSPLGGASWRARLLPTLPPPAVEAAAGGEGRHEAWVRYLLRSAQAPSLSGRVAPSEFVERQVRRRSRRGDREIKPQAWPGLALARARFEGIGAVDEEIDRLLGRLDALAVAARGLAWGASAPLQEMFHEGFDALMEALGRSEDLWWDDEPLVIKAAPLLPGLRVRSASAGVLALEWSPRLDVLVEAGRGYVLDWEGSLWPLSRALPGSMRPLLREPLPPVPLEALPEFLREFALVSPAPVELVEDDPQLGALVEEAERVEPRLLLSEEEGALRVRARFAYQRRGGSVEVDAGREGALVTGLDAAQAPLVLRRQGEAEAAALEALRAWLPEGFDARLRGDAAWGFLLEGLPLLEGRWVVFGAGSLREHRAAGTLEPAVRVRGGLAGFDLDVAFEVGGESASAGQILRSWLEGEKFYRLRDGAVAKLPVRWLSEHGEALAELEELRRVAEGPLGAWAAPVAARLLAQSGEAEAARWVEVAARVEASAGLPAWAPAAAIQATLRGYQEEGARWLVHLRELGLGGILADDMGLGKTLQALAVLADTHARSPGLSSLVICPVSVAQNWALEAAKFTPSLRVQVYHGAARGALPAAEAADVIVSTYALLRLEAGAFQGRAWRYVVLDEAQNIKNADSQTAQAARGLRAAHRLAISGTPMENHLLELWSVASFALPGFFGSRERFVARYARPIQERGDAGAQRALKARLRPFVLRRRKEEVCAELPPRQEQVLVCDLSAGERHLYESLRRTWRAALLAPGRAEGRQHLEVLEALTRLRQACCHPALVPLEEARAVTRSSKLELLVETLEALLSEGHRALVFSQWPSLLKLAMERLRPQGWGWLYLDGQTQERQALVERWNHPEGPPLFLISLKAGGTGLNLTGADCVIHLDPWWNPAAEAQATDRAHRIGQSRPVHVYRLVARDTVEEAILGLQERKRALLEGALDGESALARALTREDLERLLE